MASDVVNRARSRSRTPQPPWRLRLQQKQQEQQQQPAAAAATIATKPHPERLSRWLSWVLCAGYKELGITSDDVWACLSEVAAAGKRSRRDVGSLVNADALHGFLIESDTDCRFEVV